MMNSTYRFPLDCQRKTSRHDRLEAFTSFCLATRREEGFDGTGEAPVDDRAVGRSGLRLRAGAHS